MTVLSSYYRYAKIQRNRKQPFLESNWDFRSIWRYEHNPWNENLVTNVSAPTFNNNLWLGILDAHIELRNSIKNALLLLPYLLSHLEIEFKLKHNLSSPGKSDNISLVQKNVSAANDLLRFFIYAAINRKKN